MRKMLWFFAASLSILPLSGCRPGNPTATPPPFSSLTSLPAVPATDKTAGGREVAEDQPPYIEPPSATLKIAGQEQISGIGTYCWTKATGVKTAISLCGDTAGIITSPQPLSVRSPFTAHFHLPVREYPAELALTVIQVVPDESRLVREGQWREWITTAGEQYTLPLKRQPAIRLSLEPGLYVLHLFAQWQNQGDVSYGFLVNVSGDGR